MKLNEQKLLDYLRNHIGENTTTERLIKDSGACEEEIDFELDGKVRRIARENGYRLNDDHCKDEFWGMPWVFDFFIEDADVDRDLARIRHYQPRIALLLIEKEYGIYDYNGTLIGFRTSIPYRIKQFYDETGEMLKEYERQGILID
ncbi:MAG: hypothetical protein IJI44_03980 [Erysipelotrichaceae bacterium]|nr:hypothetical protein [Erysipelotrichaceae bacterium]